MLTVAVVAIIIIAIIGIFRWKRAMEPPVKAIERQGRKKWAEMNSKTSTKNDEDDLWFSTLDITSTEYILNNDD